MFRSPLKPTCTMMCRWGVGVGPFCQVGGNTLFSVHTSQQRLGILFPLYIGPLSQATLLGGTGPGTHWALPLLWWDRDAGGEEGV